MDAKADETAGPAGPSDRVAGPGRPSTYIPRYYVLRTFGKCKLVFIGTCVDRYGGALAVLGMSENPRKPSFRSPNGLLAPFLA